MDDERCPDCGAQVPSFDEPCPECLWTSQSDAEVVPYRYSKTFHLRHKIFRPYRPDQFVDEINAWLSSETGLTEIYSLVINRFQGLVSEVTLSCAGINRPSGRRFQIERLVLIESNYRRKGKPLGQGLNDWRESNPGRLLLRYVSLSATGVTYEVWLLYVEVDPAVSPAENSLW